MSHASLWLAMILAVVRQGAPPASAPLPSEPQLEVGLHTYRADNRPIGSASESGSDHFKSIVFGNDTLCSIGGTRTEPPSPPTIAWEIEGRVLSQTGDVFAVQVDWRRIWDRGTRLATSAATTSMLSLKVGDRIVLDTATPANDSGCSVAAVRLEAAMVLKSMLPFPRGGGASGGGGGRAIGADSPRWRVPETTAFDASLWLVHRQADGKELSSYLPVRAVSAGTRFAFSPVTFPRVSGQTPAGTVTVDVSGTLQPTTGPDGTIRLTVKLDRTVRVDGSAPDESRGSSVSTAVVLSPSDVLSFELPAPVDPRRAASRDLLSGHQFSLRIRIAPAARGGA